MANPEHLEILNGGGWNHWRAENRRAVPDLRWADLSGTNLSGVDLSWANLSQVNLTRANLQGTDLSGAALSPAVLNRANLHKANLRSAHCRGAYLNHADLSGADLSGADLSGADLSGAYLAGADLQHADLSGAQLIEADISCANLSSANLCKANLYAADLTAADLSGADLSGADLSQAILKLAEFAGADLSGALLIEARMVSTLLQEANLTNCSVYGLSAWDVDLDGAIQANLIITRRDQPVITVDDLEVAQFIYLLLNRSKLRDVITTIGEKAVLILGRFTERKGLLDSMAAKLRDLGYLPIIFDFDRPTDRDLTETVKVLAGLSRFVIADITNPHSVPLELQATVPDYMVPFVTIVQRDQPAFGMFDDLPRKYHWALPLLEYKNADTLLAAFEKKVIDPALEKLAESGVKKRSFYQGVRLRSEFPLLAVRFKRERPLRKHPRDAAFQAGQHAMAVRFC